MPSDRDPRTVAWTRMGIRWRATGDGEWPYRAHVDGHDLVIRVNDFPAEPLYTVFVDEVLVGDLEDWPSVWVKGPAAKG